MNKFVNKKMSLFQAIH